MRRRNNQQADIGVLDFGDLDDVGVGDPADVGVLDYGESDHEFDYTDDGGGGGGEGDGYVDGKLNY